MGFSGSQKAKLATLGWAVPPPMTSWKPLYHPSVVIFWMLDERFAPLVWNGPFKVMHNEVLGHFLRLISRLKHHPWLQGTKKQFQQADFSESNLSESNFHTFFGGEFLGCQQLAK